MSLTLIDSVVPGSRLVVCLTGHDAVVAVGGRVILMVMAIAVTVVAVVVVVLAGK